jgi:polyisoprenoid-binding protein YceI
MKAAPLFLVAALASALSPSTAAQTEKWQIDADHSTAVVALAPSTHPSDTLNYGVAMVGGYMSLDAANLSRLSFVLNIFPAEQASALLNPDGTWRVGALAKLSRYTVFNFESKPATRGADGKLHLTGDLTITHVVRTQPSDFSVAYSGSSASGPPDVQTLTREVSFILEKPDADIAYGWKVGWMEIKGLGTLALEDAPSLWSWLSDSVWPLAVEDRRCFTLPHAANGRDYRGAACTGTLVETQVPEELPRSGSIIDYSGARYTVPEKINQLRLTLDLKLREPK